MTISEWKLPIRATWRRALELLELRFTSGTLELTLAEEESGDSWALVFKPVQAFRSTTEECSAQSLESLPTSGGLFEIVDSPWIKELGAGQVHFLEKARHFVVCCYDEVVEVVAWEGRASRLQRAKQAE